MKFTWEEPKLEVLDITNTMAGPGIKNPDGDQTDPDEDVHYS
jgi:hypothetical protein